MIIKRFRFARWSSLSLILPTVLASSCSQEAQVGSTTESKLLSEYSSSTQEYDNIKPTVSESAITGTITGETSLSLTWTKATDDTNGSAASALSYRVYMSQKANISTPEEVSANGTALTEWTADQESIAVTLPTLKSMNNLYVNVLVKDEKGNTSPYAMTSLKNDSPFGDLYLKGTKNSSDLSELLAVHQDGSSLIYDAYLVSNADSTYKFKIANSDDSVTWSFADMAVDSSSSPAPTKETSGLIQLDVTGGTVSAAKVNQVAFDISDKENPKILVKPNAPYKEVEFDLQLKTSKVLTYTGPLDLVAALRTALTNANTTEIVFPLPAAQKETYEHAFELYQDDLTGCTLKNAGYVLRQKLVVAVSSSETNLPNTFPAYTNVDASSAGLTTHTLKNPLAVASAASGKGSLYYSVSLKSRDSDRQDTYDRNTTILAGLTSDKSDEFTKTVGLKGTTHERNNAFKSYTDSGCSSSAPCTFTTIADALQKFPNTTLGSSSSATLSNLAGTSKLYDAEFNIFAKQSSSAPFPLGDVRTKKVTLNLTYEVDSNGTATLIYARMGFKIEAGSSVESSNDYKTAVSKIQVLINAWSALSDWIEPTDSQMEKTSFLYKHFNKCQ